MTASFRWFPGALFVLTVVFVGACGGDDADHPQDALVYDARPADALEVGDGESGGDSTGDPDPAEVDTREPMDVEPIPDAGSEDADVPSQDGMENSDGPLDPEDAGVDARPADVALDDASPDSPPEDAPTSTCSLPPGAPDFSPAFCAAGALWPEAALEVCWTPESAARTDFLALTTRIQNVVNEEIARHSGFDFSGWSICTPEESRRNPSDPPLVVAAIAPGAGFTADLGSGGGGARSLQIGAASASVEGTALTAFLRVMGLVAIGEERDRLASQLSPLEKATLPAFSGPRLAGQIVGPGGRCLSVPESRDPMTAVAAAIEGCRRQPTQSFRFTDQGALLSASDGAAVRPADSGDTVMVGGPPMAGTAIWDLSGMELRTIGSLCIEVPGNLVVDGQVVRTATCSGTEAQRWDVVPGGSFRHGGACLTAIGTNGPLQLKTCSTSAAQRFFFRSGGSIHFEDVCFDIEAGRPEPELTLQLYPCKGSDAAWRANQTFFLRGPLRSQGRCLEMPVAPGRQPAKLAPCNGGPLQIWDFHLARTAIQ